MIVQKTSIFPAGRDAVFQKLRPLQYIAEPYTAFEPADYTKQTWTAGAPPPAGFGSSA
ncbi:MAG: hypothetical protein IJI41_07185 [Anaerolineaceae bacterium]|nr:hypothetical protein [Anaerolineaceae bacterium]